MPSHVSLPDPGRFGLDSFAEILPGRPPITGEDSGSFDGFHKGMMRSLAPATPYECVIAENLIAMEPLELMGEAYRSWENSVVEHDGKVQELERRRREVKRDYDALVKARPVDAVVIEG